MDGESRVRVLDRGLVYGDADGVLWLAQALATCRRVLPWVVE